MYIYDKADNSQMSSAATIQNLAAVYYFRFEGNMAGASYSNLDIGTTIIIWTYHISSI